MKKKINRNLFILLFLIPSCVCLLVFYIYPIIQILITSFYKWDYTNLANPEILPAGELLSNYEYIFTKYPYFWEALRNSLCWALVGIFIQVPLTLVVAIAISKGLRFSRFARNVYIIPSVISSAAMASSRASGLSILSSARDFAAARAAFSALACSSSL